MTHTPALQSAQAQTDNKPNPVLKNDQHNAAPDTEKTEAAGDSENLTEVVAALDAHEVQFAEQRRRAEQAVLLARQRFD